MAVYAIAGKAEATRGTGRWSLDKREKRKRPFSSAGHKTDQQCGVLCHAAGLAYDPKSWALESGQERKAEAPV